MPLCSQKPNAIRLILQTRFPLRFSTVLRPSGQWDSPLYITTTNIAEMIYARKNQSVLRPASRPPSPPGSPVAAERVQPLSRVPFNFRRSSLAPATSPSPPPLIHDGSYLEALGLRLNEAVSKALALPSGPSLPSELLGGRRPIPAGRGRALGLLIAAELQAAPDNTHLYRAVLRALHKPLSVLLSDLSALLLPLLSSPAFLQTLAPALEVPIPNATQLHALAIADFAGELLSSFDDMALGLDTDSRGDGLKPIRAGLVSLISRVVTPLMTGIKEGLVSLVDALETPGKTASPKVKGPVHPSILVLQSSVPVYSRVLARCASTHPSHTLLASFLISIVWRALVALSHRPMMAPSSPEVVLSEKGRYAPSPGLLSGTCRTGLFNLKRSRPVPSLMASTAAVDAKALYKALSQLPRPRNQVACEAVDEAFVHLEALASLLEVVGDPFFEAKKTAEEIANGLDSLTMELPTLIALPILLRMRCFEGILDPPGHMIGALFDIPEDVYRRDCLTGFGRAEEYGPIVAQRVLDEVYSRPVGNASECLVDWLEARLGQGDR